MTEIYHFIGLGGIGMSALARILIQKGHKVRGSDAASSELLEDLKKEGAEIFVGHQSDLSFEKTTVIYSSAIQKTNLELLSAQKQNAPILHRSDLLNRLIRNQKPLCVTGTHGKTTTTALLASVLLEAGLDPTMVLGGYLRSTNCNAKNGSGDYFVLEADESDGSFLKTASFGAIVTNLGRDHLDYWKSLQNLKAGFVQFLDQVAEKKHLFWCIDDPSLADLAPDGVSYGFSANAQWRIVDFTATEKGISFSLISKEKTYRSIHLSLLGQHNALNGAAVFGLALSLGIPEAVIRSAFVKFAGTGRRLEKKGEAHKVTLYDDYGHHPTEIRATLKALRAHIRERRLVVLFQPHRYSRVADLWDQFFDCFEEADLLILTDIYGASETPKEGITTASFYQAMREKLQDKVRFIPRDALETETLLHLHSLDVVVTLGAGDITQVGPRLLNHWKEKGAKLKVALLCGGTSAEHEVSLMSAVNVLKSLDPSSYEVELFGVTKEGSWLVGPDVIETLKNKKMDLQTGPRLSPEVLTRLTLADVAIPVFHGPQGEDGMMQAFLDTLQIPYVGCEYRGAVMCMQKGWTKYAALMNHIPTAPFIEVNKFSYRQNELQFLNQIETKIAFPVWIKPVHLGSSIGVSRANSRKELIASIELAFEYDDLLIAEKEVIGRQIEFAVLGNDFIRVMNCCEILNHGHFYDYETKYGAQAMGTQIPAQITPTEKMIGFDLAKKAYVACGCKGLARVDFFLDQSGHYWLNEINPFPGFTATSAYPKMCEDAGMDASALSDELIALALQKSRSLSKIRGK